MFHCWPLVHCPQKSSAFQIKTFFRNKRPLTFIAKRHPNYLFLIKSHQEWSIWIKHVVDRCLDYISCHVDQNASKKIIFGRFCKCYVSLCCLYQSNMYLIILNRMLYHNGYCYMPVCNISIPLLVTAQMIEFVAVKTLQSARLANRWLGFASVRSKSSSVSAITAMSIVSAEHWTWNSKMKFLTDQLSSHRSRRHHLPSKRFACDV